MDIARGAGVKVIGVSPKETAPGRPGNRAPVSTSDWSTKQERGAVEGNRRLSFCAWAHNSFDSVARWINSFSGTPAVGGRWSGPAGGGGGGNRGQECRQETGYSSSHSKSPAPDAIAAVVTPPKPVEPPKPAPYRTEARSNCSSVVTRGSARSENRTGTAATGTGTQAQQAQDRQWWRYRFRNRHRNWSCERPRDRWRTGQGLSSVTNAILPSSASRAPVAAGYHLIAYFDVDEKGNAKLLGFNPSRDGGYNRKLRDVLSRCGSGQASGPTARLVAILWIFSSFSSPPHSSVGHEGHEECEAHEELRKFNSCCRIRVNAALQIDLNDVRAAFR